jgi:hypothetical protein
LVLWRAGIALEVSTAGRSLDVITDGWPGGSPRHNDRIRLLSAIVIALTAAVLLRRCVAEPWWRLVLIVGLVAVGISPHTEVTAPLADGTTRVMLTMLHVSAMAHGSAVYDVGAQLRRHPTHGVERFRLSHCLPW